MTLDPLTLWFYRGALGAVVLVCVIGAILLLAKAGSVEHRTGLSGWLAWWVQDGKSYAMSVAASVATALYGLDYLSFERWTVVMGLINGTAIATMRAAQGKTTQAAKEATEAASEAASTAAATEQTVKRGQGVTPARVPAPIIPDPAALGQAVPKPTED